MPNHLVPGYVTKKTAAKRCNRSLRQISRDLAGAMSARDTGVLEQHMITVDVDGIQKKIRSVDFLGNAKLRTEDGTLREGADVTNAQVKELRDQGKNPTWYFKASWMNEQFGKRTDDEEAASESSVTTTQVDEPEIIALLKEQIDDLKVEKKQWNEERKEMREDARETRKLMNQMQQLMGHMQDRLLPQSTVTKSDSHSSQNDSPIVSKEGSHSSEATGQSTRNKDKAHAPKPRRHPRKSEWYHMPTFKRFFTRR